MGTMPGWMAGAVGVGALVGAFYLGGRVNATPVGSPMTAGAPAAIAAGLAVDASPLEGLAVECEPGQRAVVRATADERAPRVACVSDARPAARTGPAPSEAAYAPVAPSANVVRVVDTSERPYARPAVITEPMEVYRPRARSTTYDARTVPRPRSVGKSVAIIGGSTAAGAVVGGLLKGGKGAVIGGLLGGGAATVWDQATRRRDAEVR